MEIFDTTALPPIAWKNGGGITREIAQAPGPRGFAWRLSVADVAQEGPFSTFPGLQRILTVIDGSGLELHSPDKAHALRFATPFPFSGETPIRSVLRNGPIRDFNVIYDPQVVDADVQALTGPDERLVGGGLCAIFVVSGGVTLDTRSCGPGTMILLRSEPVRLGLPDGATCLIATLADRAASVG